MPCEDLFGAKIAFGNFCNTAYHLVDGVLCFLHRPSNAQHSKIDWAAQKFLGVCFFFFLA
jgi:hypothetical protein